MYNQGHMMERLTTEFMFRKQMGSQCRSTTSEQELTDCLTDFVYRYNSIHKSTMHYIIPLVDLEIQLTLISTNSN